MGAVQGTTTDPGSSIAKEVSMALRRLPVEMRRMRRRFADRHRPRDPGRRSRRRAHRARRGLPARCTRRRGPTRRRSRDRRSHTRHRRAGLSSAFRHRRQPGRCTGRRRWCRIRTARLCTGKTRPGRPLGIRHRRVARHPLGEREHSRRLPRASGELGRPTTRRSSRRQRRQGRGTP